MKNEKLELLLNKVVEFNKPEKVNFKGFLYKDQRGYYIKVVEHISGTDVAVNDKLYLKAGEEQYIIHAEKPKLMRVSLKSWHYRLIQFVLKSNAPTPKTMQNGCPYFWLLVFSIFALPFVLVYNSFKAVFLSIPELMFWSLEKLVDLWIPNVDDAEAYEYYWGGRYSENYKMPLTAKLYFDKSDDDFMDYFMLEKYKIDRKISPEEYEKKKLEMSDKWKIWREERDEARRKRREEESIRDAEQRKKRDEYMRKKAIRDAEWEARTKPFREGLAKIFVSIGEAFTFDPKNWKDIIKKTKQVVGAVITILLLAITYFAVNGISFVLMAVADWCIANWEIFAGIGIFAIACGIIYAIYVLITGWVQGIVNKYEGGKKIWYIEPVIYLIWYPVKYIALFIAYAVVYVIWTPIKFIFYTVLWKLFLVNAGLLIWKGISSLGGGLANSTGVFGEYFSASYTDYCPGIEWVDTPEEE